MVSELFIYTDVGDTLLFLKSSAGETYFNILQKYGVAGKDMNAGDFKKVFKESWNEMSSDLPPDGKDRFISHPRGTRGWWEDLIDIFSVKLSGKKIQNPKIYEEIFNALDDPDVWILEPTLNELLTFAKENHIGIGIISNWDLRLRELLTSIGIIHYFDPVIVSSEFGYEKPSALIFEKAMQITGLPPESHIYVGDKIHFDYTPTKALGWQSYILDPAGKEEFKNCETIKSLSELIGKIKEL